MNVRMPFGRHGSGLYFGKGYLLILLNGRMYLYQQNLGYVRSDNIWRKNKERINDD